MALVAALPGAPLAALAATGVANVVAALYTAATAVLALAAALGPIAWPGLDRAQAVERAGIAAVVGWVAAIDAAVVADAYLGGAARPGPLALALAGGAYLVTARRAFAREPDLAAGWALSAAGAAAVWLTVAAAGYAAT